ncbi:MAG: hypothetical protein P8168_02155 [Deltaproteobacteria bacterium]
MADLKDLKEPLKKVFSEAGRETEPLEPLEIPAGLHQEVEIETGSDRRGNECICPQCGKELPARIGADCNIEYCPECGLAMQVR